MPIFYPNVVQASLLSFLQNITGDDANAKTNDIDTLSTNSQNMTILRAATNSDPNLYKLDNTTPIVSGNALLAEIGPYGTLKDIEDQTNNTQISIYTVREGDNISNIAQMFDVSVNTIIWANNLNKKSILKQGQNLIILPISGIQHKVSKGETIKNIVKKYNADLDEVLKYNDISLNSTV